MTVVINGQYEVVSQADRPLSREEIQRAAENHAKFQRCSIDQEEMLRHARQSQLDALLRQAYGWYQR